MASSEARLKDLSNEGYGMGSHCVVIFLGTMIHTSHDHLFFYSLWAVLGGLATLRMVSIVVSRTQGQSQRMIVCGAVAALNLLFLLYLHFAYHQIVEDLSEVFAPAHNNMPVAAATVNVADKGDNPPINDIGAKVTELAQEVVRSVVKSVNETVRDSVPLDTANKVIVNAEGIVPT